MEANGFLSTIHYSSVWQLTMGTTYGGIKDGVLSLMIRLNGGRLGVEVAVVLLATSFHIIMEYSVREVVKYLCQLFTCQGIIRPTHQSLQQSNLELASLLSVHIQTTVQQEHHTWRVMTDMFCKSKVWKERGRLFHFALCTFLMS